jgi:hypothetical protein
MMVFLLMDKGLITLQPRVQTHPLQGVSTGHVYSWQENVMSVPTFKVLASFYYLTSTSSNNTADR